jgi:hypothetical protein
MSLKPVIFNDGSDFFGKLEKEYITHKNGLFILTPSGAGKTYYCDRQEEPHWIDGDKLWYDTGAQPPLPYDWWNKGPHIINRVEQRCDVITAEAVDRGFWIMGSVNYWLKPDAIVIPDIDTLMGQIKHRQDSNYDGGLKEEHFDQLIVHIGIIRDWRMKFGVPEYKTIAEAVTDLQG